MWFAISFGNGENQSTLRGLRKAIGVDLMG